MVWWRRRQEQRSATFSVSDPAFAEFFGVGVANYSGVTIGETSALGLSAVWRAVNLIAGTLASLPLRTLRDTGDGMKQRMTSFLDDPGGPDGPTPFAWKETIFTHALLHGDAFLAHVFNGAGAIAALIPIHPLAVSVRWVRADETPRPGGKVYTASLADGTRQEFDASTMTQVSGLTLDGLRGVSVVSYARSSLGTAVAADRAAAKLFGSGALISGMVTPEEDLDEDEAKQIKAGLNRGIAGWENAAEIAVINRKLKFTPWQMNAEDAQFLQSRVFQVEEIARWFGIPPHLLGQTEKVTSWGAGIEVQNRGLARTVLMPWARRFEERLSRLLPAPRFVEFDFAGLERPTPEQEIDLLIKQVESGLLTLNEARAIRNMPPVAGGDVAQGTTPPAAAVEEVAA
jgi:HK97 family phage portal protein